MGPLPGNLGWCIFGQPIWANFAQLCPGPVTKQITGSAIITNPAILPTHRTLKISGSAVIQRKNIYLT